MRTFIRSTLYHARVVLEKQSFRGKTMEADDRALLMTYPKCRQRNRLKYEETPISLRQMPDRTACCGRSSGREKRPRVRRTY
jgi:hypothetical protein